MRSTRSLARLLLSGVFVHGGVDVLRRPEPRVEVARPFLDQVTSRLPEPAPEPVTLVRLNAAVQVVGGGLLALGWWPRLAALLLAGSLVPTTIGGHRFWGVDDPAVVARQRVQVLKNAAILGGLLLVIDDRPPPRPA